MPTKIYERHLTEANGFALNISNAERPSKCFAVEFPHEFNIKKVVCTIAAGTATSFDVALYNQAPCSLDPVGDMSESLGAVDNKVLSQVGGILSSSGSPAVVQLFLDHGIPFRNMEGTQTVPKRRIFVEISNIVGGSDDLVFELALGGEVVLAF